MNTDEITSGLKKYQMHREMVLQKEYVIVGCAIWKTKQNPVLYFLKA